MSNTLPYKHIQEQTERQLLNIIVDKLCCISENTTANNEYKIAYYQEISDTTGTVTVPEGGTILLNQLAGGADALVSTIDGVPTGSFPQTAGGVMVDVTSFDVDGNWVLSGTPSAYPVALIYWLKISAADYSNLNINNIIEENIPLLVDNIYNTDGTLTGDRTITGDGNDLIFDGGGGTLIVNSTTGITSKSLSNATIKIERDDNVQYGAALKYFSGNSEKWVVGLSDAGDFAGSTGNEFFIGNAKTNPLFLINASQNIGIGTTTPGYKLEVNGTSRLNGRVTLGGNVNNFIQGEGDNLRFNSVTNFSFVRAGNTFVTIRETGNVGIGTTAPSAQIHADNTATTGVGAIIENSNVTNTDDLIQFHNSTGEVASITNEGGLTASHDVTFTGGSGGSYELSWNGKTLGINNSSGTLSIGTTTIGNNLGMFKVYADGSFNLNGTDNSPQIRRDAADAVSSLTVLNANASSTGDIAQFHNSTGKVASVTNDGGAGFGNSSIDASAKVEITSTTKGFLPPRMTGTQAEAIATPAEGLMVYSTDGSGVTITSKGWWGYDGSTWVQLN